MEKLDLQTFRKLKQEIIEYVTKSQETRERGEYLSDEEEEQFIARYREIIKILSEHDLSDIDFEEWRGMYLDVDKDLDLTIDFSRTRANIDFSIITYYSNNAFPNFKSCKIKNFDFEKYDYTPEMFDEEYRKEHEGHFLSDAIPEDVADRFYKGELTLTDIQDNPELAEKIEEKNLAYNLRRFYSRMGREEFCKLDAPFIDKTSYVWKELLNANPNLKTAKEIMPVLYQSAIQKIIGYPNETDISRRFYFRQDELGEEFEKQNPDLILSEKTPEEVRNSYYGHCLSLRDFSENLQYFEGKTVAQSFANYGFEKKFISLYGEGVYELFAKYKLLMDKVINNYTFMQALEVPAGPITEEQRKQIMSQAILAYYNETQEMQSYEELRMAQDFIPLENLPLTKNAREFLGKYGIDGLIESGLDIKYIMPFTRLTSVEEISKLKGIELNDIKKLVPEKSRAVLGAYTPNELLEYGIKDLSELSESTNDLYKIRELLKERPIDLINLGGYEVVKRQFIKKYGIDNIIALDEETGGMFSHPLNANDIYLTMFANAEKQIPELELSKKLTFEQFRVRMYEILFHARDDKGILRSGDYPDYDFIHGRFREEHPEIFIDEDVDIDIKRKFYIGRITAKDVRNNPQLIEILQGKYLSKVFHKKMSAGISMEMLDKDGNRIGAIPNTVNMAEYLSDKIGKEEFLKICADYGECLDNITLMTKNEITVQSLREMIEGQIYKAIKERGIEYFGDLPLSFREKHPDLFLPEDIDENLRTKFYEGRLSFEDIRQNPSLKAILQSKDISVGFGKTKYGQQIIGNNRHVNPLWEKLTEQEIMDLAEEYGKYLNDVNAEIFVEGQGYEERIKALQGNIEQNILDRRSPYDETIPEFFKQKYPEMFLDKGAPEELKQAFYDNKASQKNHMDISGDTVDISFNLIYEHPEWREFLIGKDLSRAFSKQYDELFKRFDNSVLMKLAARSPQAIEKMVENHKEDALKNWYKATGGRFIPHHVVMLNFPEEKIDSFLRNSKRWSQLMRISRYNLNDDRKTAILKAAYSLGVFQGNDEAFNITMHLFTDIPQELSQDEYKKVIQLFDEDFDPSKWSGTSIDSKEKEDEIRDLFKEAYTLHADKSDNSKEEDNDKPDENDNDKFVLRIDKQKNRDSVKRIREILEKAEISRILTPQKSHQIFDSFAMEYNPDFAKFFYDNIEEILSDSEYTKDIATIQRQFKDIVRVNAGRRLTLDVAEDYIRSIVYENVEIGNEGVAEQAKIVGYSQKDFEAIQDIFNEGEMREFSSIPRIQGKTNGYTYEMLRCDDPLALTIGTLTNCCQEIHGAGQSSMEHSVISPDGRVFCVKDSLGRLVAQSWFWRNKYTGCFDNIEIPDRIFKLYEKEHSSDGRKDLTSEVLEVYKKAAQDLMQEDKRVYDELLENGTITKEQYDALLLGKVTIGLGYNDIADAIKKDKTIHEEQDKVRVIGTEKLPNPYTDAAIQYTIAEREGIVKSDQENLYVHQDDIPIYDETNMSSIVLFTMKRMEQATGRDNLAYVSEEDDKEKLPRAKKIIRSIAREYGLDPSITKVMATARMALIYSKEKDKIKIGDLLSSPIKTGLTEEQEQRAKMHIINQVKKALKQIGIQGSEVDTSLLTKEQSEMLQTIMQEIEKENAERGEK